MDSSQVKLFRSRILTTYLILIFFGIGVAIKASTIQLIEYPRLARMANRQFHSKFWIQPKRGSISDRNGEPLAFNIETKSLAIDPRSIQHPVKTAQKISRALKLPYSVVRNKIKSKKSFLWIRRQLDENEIRELLKEKLIQDEGPSLPGIVLVKESGRRYPSKNLAGQIIGKVNIDSEGVEGLEYKWNERLTGKGVSIRAIRDAKGRPTFFDPEAAQSIKDGENLTLTIDAPLQYAVEELLQSAVTKLQAKAASAIVMNADNGEILAMATEPKGIGRNTSVTDGYEPGSTLKSVLLANALTKGMTLKSKFWGEHGSIVIQGRRISEAEAHEKFEWVTLKEMIQKSSNVVSAKLAIKVGADSYYETLKSFGFGNSTGIDFPGEISGRIPQKKSWTPISLANIGFGHGILVTPIQMISAYATFANGGKKIKPKLILDTLNPADNQNAELKTILKPEIAQQVTEALISVTSKDGTGNQAALDGFLIAGKTGTAQKIDPVTKSYSRSKYVASFIGYPVGINPRIVIFTSVDEPKKAYYASVTAAPLFREILQATINRMSIPATEPLSPQTQVLNQLASSSQHKAPTPNTHTDEIETTQSAALVAAIPSETELGQEIDPSTQGLKWKMPNLHGLSAREALESLEGRPFRLKIQGTGLVAEQSPSAGTELKEGSAISLKLAQ